MANKVFCEAFKLPVHVNLFLQQHLPLKSGRERSRQKPVTPQHRLIGERFLGDLQYIELKNCIDVGSRNLFLAFSRRIEVTKEDIEYVECGNTFEDCR